MESVSLSNPPKQHQLNIKPKLKSSKKKSLSAIRKSKSRMTTFNSTISRIKSLNAFYPDMEFQLLKSEKRSTGPSIGWMKIDYGQCDSEPKKRFDET